MKLSLDWGKLSVYSIAVEHQREGDGGLLILGIGELQVDGDGVIIVIVGEGNLIVDGVAVFVVAHSCQGAGVGGAVVDVGKINLLDFLHRVYPAISATLTTLMLSEKVM